jgi:ATPase subunit of ABC transporter with duplicated ATPase domains
MSATLLVADKVSRRHGERSVLEDVTLRVSAGSRIGLVGPNGSGKTTLLRILAGLEAPDGGTVTAHGTVGLLSATPDRARTGREAILAAVGIDAAVAEMTHWERRLGAGDTGAIEPHAAALERWIALGGADAEARLAVAAAELGLGPDLLDRSLTELSGGQAARIGLAAIALARHDVALLDEPSNHLDAEGLTQLRRLIAERSGPVVIVAHDRRLLAEVCTEVVALDLHSAKATHYQAGYDVYEAEQRHARDRALREHQAAAAQRDALIAAEREMRRRAERSASKAKSSQGLPDSNRGSREFVRARAQERAGRAARMATRRERIEIPDKPWEDPALRLSLTSAERRQAWVASLEGARWERGSWTLGPLDLTVSTGERLLLSGPNGAGKSTVMATLAGRLRPDAGRVQISESAVVAELGQLRSALSEDRPLSAAVRVMTGLDEADARGALAWFGLGADHARRSAASLSPGERTRAELAVLAHRRATCLLLDEPSNHLDIESIGVLESALDGWPGALVIATHDLRLRSRLAPDREVALAGR